MLQKFLNSNSTVARFVRTIVQGIVSILIVVIPTYVGDIDTSTVSGALVALVMAVLSALMGMFSQNDETEFVYETTGEVIPNTEMGQDAADAVEEE